MGKRVLIAVLLFLGTVVVLSLYLPGLRPQTTTVSGTATIGGPFTLTDTKGNTVTEDVLKGHLNLVYFGYTFCPDVCPLALQHIAQAVDIAGPGTETVLPVFITIDPDRDTKEVMAEYIAHFSPRLIGLTGSPEQIKQAEDVYRVFAAKAGGTPGKADYMMDHTGYIYLMDKNGKYLAHFGKDAEPREIAARLRREANPQ